MTNTNTGETFCSIQAAIDDSDTANGHTIVAGNGNYPESPNVTKELTIKSLNGRDATTVTLQSGPTYLGALTVNASNVTIDGFTVKGFDAVGAGLASSNIVVVNGKDNVKVRNARIVVGQVGSGANGDDGIGLLTYYSEGPDLIDSLTVTNTIFTPLGASAFRAFYINPGVAAFVFKDNTITGQFGATSITQAQDGLVEENTVTGVYPGGGDSRGLAVWGYPNPALWGHTVFRSNVISGTNRAIGLFDAESVLVEKNILTNNGSGVEVIDTGSSLVFDASTIVVQRNDLSMTTMGINNADGEIAVGRCNWWGDASGPGPVGPGSGSNVSANVDFAPFLLTSDLNGPCAPPADIDVTSTITDITAPIVAGRPYSFTVDVSNHGPVMAEGVTVHDLIQGIPGVQVTSIITAPNWFCSGDLTCTRQNAMPISTETVATVTVNIPANTAPGVYSHLLSATADNPDIDLSNNVATFPFTVTTAADLSVAKRAIQSVAAPGGQLLFEVEVTNNGPSVAASATMTDALAAGFPAGAQIVAVSPSCSGAPGTQVTCTVSNLGVGQKADFLVAVQAPPGAAVGSVITNTATVADIGATIGNNGPVTATGTVTSTLPEAKLTITQDTCTLGTIPTRPGDSAYSWCSFKIKNDGPGTAENVNIASFLVGGLPHDANYFSSTDQTLTANETQRPLYDCSGTVSGFCMRAYSMPAGATDTFSFYFTLPADAHLTAPGTPGVQPYLRIGVNASNPDPQINVNPYATFKQISFDIYPTVALKIDKIALQNKVSPGGTALFAVTISNTGPSDIDGIRITDTLTSGNGTVIAMAPADANAATGGSGLYIPARGSQTVLVSVQIADSALVNDVITNVATIDTALVDAGVSTNGVGAAGYDGTLTGSDSANLVVGPSLPPVDIDVTSTITDITAPIVAGLPYSFTVEVSNNGPAMAEGVTVHDLIQGIPGVQVHDILTPNWFTLRGRPDLHPRHPMRSAHRRQRGPTGTVDISAEHRKIAADSLPDCRPPPTTGTISNNDAPDTFPFTVGDGAADACSVAPRAVRCRVAQCSG